MKSGATEHPKILDLADWADTATEGGFVALGIDPVSWAAGAMERLWQWTAKYAPAGDVGRFSDARIADAMGWRRDAKTLVDAMVRFRLLDKSEACRLVVHDWSAHCEDAVHARLARARCFFADGTVPKLTKLDAKEKPAAEVFFSTAESGARRPPSATNGVPPLPLPLPLPSACSPEGEGSSGKPRAIPAEAPPSQSSVGTEPTDDKPADLVADPEKPIRDADPADWRRACVLASMIEGEAHEMPVRGAGKAIRPLAIAYAAERLQGGWDVVEPVIFGILAKHKEAPELSRILGELRNWPDGAYPGNGKRPTDAKSPPSRIEQAATVLRGLGWQTFRNHRKKPQKPEGWTGTG